MPLQNRVTPLGELVADQARGLVYGNRGCLHDEAGRIRRDFAVKRWIACRLEFKGRRRTRLLQPGRYTELFFLDEATAFAAGHRPCAECRREDYDRFVALVGARADEIDERLHAERLDASRERRLHPARLRDLPDGAFVLEGGRRVARARRRAAALDAVRLRRAAPAARRRRRADHTAVPRRGPPHRLAGSRAVPASVGVTPWLEPTELRIGLGCMRLPPELAFETIAAAAEAGVTVFDTARAYDGNEQLLARALRRCGAAETARIVTKGGMTRPGGAWIPDGRAKAILADCEASLSALDGLPIDLYLLHAPDPRTPWKTSVRALARLADEGLVRRIGLANVNRRRLDEALELAPVAAIQVALQPLRRPCASRRDGRALR